MPPKFNLKRFCADSTIHGFREMYYSDKTFWKVFWAVVIVGGIAITAYQVYDAVETYLKQPTVTNVYPLREDWMKPDIDFCFDIKYVYAWLSFNKSVINENVANYVAHLIMKLTRLSNLDLFLSNPSNIKGNINSWWFKYASDLEQMANSSAENFSKFLSDNFISNEIAYIQKFISKSSNVIEQDDKSVAAKKITFGSEDVNNNYICYSFSLNDNPQFALRFDNYDWFTVYMIPKLIEADDFTTGLLYGYNYFNSFAYGVLNYSFPENFNITKGSSWLLNSENIGSDGIKVGIGNLRPISLKRNTKLTFELNVNKLISLNLPSGPCNTADSSIPSYVLNEIPPRNNIKSNFSCYSLCMYKKLNRSDCLTVDQTVGLQRDEKLDIRICKPEYDSYPFILETDRDCESKCPEACTQWYFFASTQISNLIPDPSHPKCQIEINFPLSQYILVTEESMAYTWTSLIGNVGGLMGLWLGASLLSFLQGIYLFFFSPKKVADEGYKLNPKPVVKLSESNTTALQTKRNVVKM